MQCFIPNQDLLLQSQLRQSMTSLLLDFTHSGVFIVYFEQVNDD